MVQDFYTCHNTLISWPICPNKLYRRAKTSQSLANMLNVNFVSIFVVVVLLKLLNPTFEGIFYDILENVFDRLQVVDLRPVFS